MFESTHKPLLLLVAYAAIGVAGCTLLSDLGPGQCEIDADCEGVDDLPTRAFRCEAGLCVEATDAPCSRNTDCPDQVGQGAQMCVAGRCVDLTLDQRTCRPIGFERTRDDHLVVGVLSPKRPERDSFPAQPTVAHVVEQIQLGWGDVESGRFMVVLCDPGSSEAARSVVEYFEDDLRAPIILTEQPAGEVAGTFTSFTAPVLTTYETHPSLETSGRAPDLFHLVGYPGELVDGFGAALGALLAHLEQTVYAGSLPADLTVALLRPTGDQEPAGLEVRERIEAEMVSAGVDGSGLIDLPSALFPLSAQIIPPATVAAFDARPAVVVSLHGRNFSESLLHFELSMFSSDPFYVLDHGARALELLSDVPQSEVDGYPRRVIGVEHSVIPERYDAYAGEILPRTTDAYPFGRDRLHDALFMAGLAIGRLHRRAVDPTDRVAMREAIDALDDGPEAVRVFDATSFASALERFDDDTPTLRFSGIAGDLTWSDEGVWASPVRAYCPASSNPTEPALRVAVPFTALASSCW